MLDEPKTSCVDVPALALQLLLRAHPEWQDEPVVVVEDDRPQAAILWANRAAREQRIVRGMGFMQARALSKTLHAEVVPEHALDAAIDALFELLLSFSPHVEPVLPEPGLFWLDPNGLASLFHGLEPWARALHERLSAERYVSAVVVGARRPSVYALARVGQGARVLTDPAAEARLAARVPLARLGVEPKLRDELGLLGVHTVGELLNLPRAGLQLRYGAQAARWHDFLNGKSWTPLLPRTPVEPLIVTLEVEPPDDDLTRLLFGFKTTLHGVAERLVAQQHAVTALQLRFELERGPAHVERVESAAPTLDVVQLVDLLRLRFADVALPSAVERIVTEVEHTRVHPRQLVLHRERTRDLEAAARALARLRASFGPDSVTRARLREAHLPEATFYFEPVREVQRPRAPAAVAGAGAGASTPLVRRLFSKPLPLPALPGHEPERWLGEHGAVTSMQGPYRIAGGWWTRRRERDYYYVETRTGELLWLFYDRPLRRWFLHGTVD
jgi:protein ImuB